MTTGGSDASATADQPRDADNGNAANPRVAAVLMGLTYLAGALGLFIGFFTIGPMLFGMMMKNGVTKEQIGAIVHALDYAKYGGAPLLGVRGVSIICHGKSSPEAIKNGLLAGLRAVETRMSHHIGEQLAK